jgi:hypothetical protein
MEIMVHSLNETDDGWDARIKVTLSQDEMSHLDKSALHDDGDFMVDSEDNSVLYFTSLLSVAEPWEDEPLEELVRAIKMEVKYRVNRLL